MQHWFLFSVLAALVWAIVNITDKFILSKWVKNPFVPIMILSIVGLLSSLFIYLFKGFSTLSYSNIILAFIAGIFYIFAILFYFKAVKIEEISRVVPLFYLTPLFVLILATIFIGEIFPISKYLGIFLLIIGAVSISSRSFTKFKLGKGFWLMFLASFALSINAVITKYLLEFADFWTVFSYVRIGTIFALGPIVYFNYKELIVTVKENGNKVIGIISLNELLNLIGILLITIAMSIGYVTLVSATSAIQPLFVFLFAIIFSSFFPKILKEELKGSIIIIKVIAIILIIVGTILVT